MGGSRAWIALGSNQGPSRALMAEALRRLDERQDVRLDAVSSLYRTPPWGDTEQPDFLNAVARVRTDLDPPTLLRRLLELETALGRRRDAGRRWGPRRIDLDLLVHEAGPWSDPSLTLPHPRLAERAFVLVPFAELDGDRVVTDHRTVNELLARLDSALIVREEGPDWVRGATGRQ